MNQNATDWKHCLEQAALTDVGLRRSNNQDSLAVVLAESERSWEQRGHLFVVADGMGAHAAGELASQLAVETVPLAYSKSRHRSAPEALREALLEANTHIHSRGQANEEFRGMGTTLSTLVLLPQGAIVGHVGDSRVYRLRDHQLEQLTFDHSLVWEVCAAEGISEAEAPSYIPRNVITRSAGPNPEVQVDLEGPFEVEVGDTFLLCSDGLSGLVHDGELGTILGCMPPEEAIKTLVDLAILRGGPDNVTGVVVQVTGRELASGAQSDLALGTSTFPKGIRPLTWGVLAAFVLAALGLAGLAVYGHPMAALAGLVGVAAFGLALLMIRHTGEEKDAPLNPQKLGKGPYTHVDCTPNEPFLEHLTELLQELRATAESRNWVVDWDGVSQISARATTAAESDDFCGATAEYGRALSFITDQLRNQPVRKTPDNGSAWVQDTG